MITKTSATITNLKNLFIEMFLDKTAKVSNVADGSVVNATAFGVAKVAQKAMKDIAIKEAQIFPDTATGVYLDKAAALYGVSPRKGALGSSTYIRVSADPGTVYDTSVTFVNKNGIRFQVDEALTVGESGYGYVKARSVNAGYSTNVPPNSITNVSPQPQGHIECTNEYYAIGGRDSEDDETFRIRIKNNLNILSKNTIEYWTQTLNNIDDRVLKVMSAGLDEKGIYNLYVVSQNGIFFTEEELDTLLESAQGYFGISELNIEGKVVGIGIKNIDWFYVGSERGLDFRVQLQPDYDVATVRQNIQVNLTKYLDFRFWTPGKIVEWDDLLDIVKKTDGVKYVPDEYFFPYYDQQVPANQLPRIKGFVMRDQDGNILYDSDSNFSPLFYPSEPEDLFVGINDSSLNLYQEVYFNVTDSEGRPVEGANISIGNNAVVTNDNGQATIRLANGQYEYITSASGYIPVEGMFVVLNGSVSIDVQMVLAPYTVTFHVTDEKGATVPYANVTMDGRTTATNLQGIATLSARNGNYPYTIEKLGYDEYSGSVTVQGSNSDVYPELEFTVWTITVIVKDKENELIPNAIVKVNNGEFLTNQTGEAEIPLVNGEYSVTIEKTGYDTLQETIKVNNQNADVTFKMDFFLYNVEFNISQVNQGNPAEDATIRIEGQPEVLTVNSSGRATTTLKNGNYNYTVQKKGYDDLTGSFNVEEQDTFIQRTLVLKHYNVVITVLDSDNSSPVQGAAVNINGSSYPTNDSGQAVASLQNGTYPYTVTKSGYYDGSSSVTVLDSDNSSVISLKARLYNVIMTVKNPLKEPINGATVEINATSYQTQSNGQVSLQLKNGTYPFTVTFSGMDDYSGELEVESADIPSFPVNMEYKKYNVVFTVQTDEGVAIENANIHINENDYKTSQGGLVTVRLSDGDYPYEVTKDGYVQTQGSISVSGSNKDVLVQLVPMSYNITFVAKDNMDSPNLLQDVSIKISSKEETLSTGTNGETTVKLKAGQYTATFSKEGYKGEELSFEVTKEETFTQILKKIWNLTFKVTSAGKSGLKDVAVSVSGAAILSGNTVSLKTKDDGTTDPVQVINGAYDWSALLAGYSPEEGVGSVQDADQEKAVELVFGFETTFTVKDEEGGFVDGAKIVIDNTETITTAQNGTAKTNLSTGSHSYTYSKEGYQSGSGTVRVNEAETSVNITMIKGAVVTFKTIVSNSIKSDVKIVVNSTTQRILPQTIVTNQSGIATIFLPEGNYTYSIPTDESNNSDLIDVPDGSFEVGLQAKQVEIDLTDYVKHTIVFQITPTYANPNINIYRKEAPDTVIDSGKASSGVAVFQNRNGNYIYTATEDGYLDLSGEFTVDNRQANINFEMKQVSDVQFTVKNESDSTGIQNALVTMTDRSNSSNKYKGTTNSNGVAVMTFDGGEFEWSQDSDADFSGCPVFQEDEKYLVPADGVTTDQLKTYFPNGVIVSPLTIVQDKDNSSITESLTRIYNSNKIDGWEGSWDKTKKNLTLTSVIKTSTASTETYVLFNVDAGLIGFSNGLFQIGTEKTVDYHKALDFGFKVSGVSSNLKIVITYGSQNAPLTVEMENDVIQRFQLSDLLLDTETIGNSTIWSVHVQSFDGGTLSADDLKNLNITFSFYGKKAISSDFPANKVLYGSYDYVVTPPLPLQPKKGFMSVYLSSVNQEVLISSTTTLLFLVYGGDSGITFLEGAKVTVSGSDGKTYSGTTGQDGVVRLYVLLGQSYNYEVTADGYLPASGETGVISDIKSISVTLEKGVEVTVAVRENTTSGSPASGAKVTAENGSVKVTGTTDTQGNAVLTVKSGSNIFTVEKSGYKNTVHSDYITSTKTVTLPLEKIYSALNVRVRRVGQMQGMPSQIQLKDSTGLKVIQTKNITTTVTFTNVAYGQYILYVPEGDFSKETSQSITVNSEGMQVQVNLTPLYMVQVKVNPTGGNVEFTDSEGQRHTGSAGPATYTARFDKIPAGNYQVKITSSGFSDFSTTGTISGVYQTSVNLEYTLTKPNKLVQITSDQSNYQLDTSYKYVSLLIVGRGGEKFEYWQSWDEFVLMGGTTGQIVYIPNILMSDISNGQINKITFSSIPNTGSWTEGTEYSIKLGMTTYEYKAYNGNGSAYNDADYPMPQGSRLNNYPVYNAKSSGGFAAHRGGTFYCSGSPGSQNTKEETYSFTGPRMQPSGAPGGDGRYGYKSSYEYTVFGDVTEPIQSSVVIPVQSIFGGTSKGEAGYLNTESGKRTGASAYGGAGYGGSYFTSPDGGITRIAGYGSGQECSPADDDAGNITKPGEGIFCIYYHNEPI